MESLQVGDRVSFTEHGKVFRGEVKHIFMRKNFLDEYIFWVDVEYFRVNAVRRESFTQLALKSMEFEVIYR